MGGGQYLEVKPSNQICGGLRRGTLQVTATPNTAPCTKPQCTCTEPRPVFGRTPTHPDALHKSDSSALPVPSGEVTRAVSPHQHRNLSPRPRQLSELHGVPLLTIKSKPPHSNDRTRPPLASQHQQPTLAAR